MPSRYLTKSRFKLGFACPTRLFYGDRPAEYHNTLRDDPFLKGLAEGGYQVGEFAKWMLCNDPAADTIDTLDHAQAIAETQRRLLADPCTIAEAAFGHEHLLVRADIVVKVGAVLNLYEVKSKSWDADERFWQKKDPAKLLVAWEEYLLDVAFQKHVVEKARPDLEVKAHLVLVDKGKCASVDGLNQLFPVIDDHGRLRVRSRVTRREQLGEDLLAYIGVDEDINKIRKLAFDLPSGGKGSFQKLVEELDAIHQSRKPLFRGVGAKCKDCPFRLPGDPAEVARLTAAGLKSGLEECWAQAVGGGYDPAQPKVIELWNFRGADKAIAEGKFYLRDLTEEDTGSGGNAIRQHLQIEKVRDGDRSPWIDTEGLWTARARWRFPLHFIDFETAQMALPGQRGRPPYGQVAFQFSHHTVDRQGRVRHAGQWIETGAGVFPNFEFVRQLKQQLEEDEGTIFRYAAHENTVLRQISDQLADSAEKDRRELMQWIDTITERKAPGAKPTDARIAGKRNMVDMREMVLNYHYDPATHGSNSLKNLLPAIMGSSTYLRRRYGSSIGAAGISSLNCEPDWVWVRAGEYHDDPYAALPPVFQGEEQKAVSDYVNGLQELDDGGTATIAYAKLQYFEVPDREREAIRRALLRYCELDTLAMVMLYEYWAQACQGPARPGRTAKDR